MRGFVITTGLTAILVVVAHVLRVLREGPNIAGDPWFVAATIVAASVAVWAWLLLRRMRKGAPS
jgi:hypothetical protein